MKTFKQHTKMKQRGKKDLDKIPEPPTIVSSPLRGQNQHYGGVGVTHDVADYTISDQFKGRK